jgi:hypothetical protein
MCASRFGRIGRPGCISIRAWGLKVGHHRDDHQKYFKLQYNGMEVVMRSGKNLIETSEEHDSHRHNLIVVAQSCRHVHSLQLSPRVLGNSKEKLCLIRHAG